MANRGVVQYTEPVVKKDNDVLKKLDVVSLIDIIQTNIQEINSLDLVINDDIVKANVVPTPRYVTTTNSADTPTSTLLNATKENIKKANSVVNININNIIQGTNYLESKARKNLVNLPDVDKYITGQDSVPKIDKINLMINNLKTISSNLDNTYSRYFSNSYCKVSCQVKCQYACQLACQSCYGGTCHNQNCGGWS